MNPEKYDVEWGEIEDDWGGRSAALITACPDGSVIKQTAMWVTPEMATKWTADTSFNPRKLRPSSVKKYLRDMAVGAWAYPVDSIVFDAEGHLVNGQHRLRACILADRPFFTDVRWGVGRAAVDAGDRGAVRNFADMVRALDIQRADKVAGAVRLSKRWEDREFRKNLVYTDRELSEWLEANPGLLDVMADAGRARRAGFKEAVCAAFFYRLHQIDGDTAEEFIEHVIEGAGLEAGDPILMWREKVITRRHASAGQKKDVTAQNADLAMAIMTWNVWISGQQHRTKAIWVYAHKFPHLRDLEHNIFMPGEDVVPKANTRKSASSRRAATKTRTK